MTVLWMKFPDEVVNGKAFSDSDKRNLENVFRETGPWRDALKTLGIDYTPATMIAWRNDTLYLNWTAYLNALTGSIMMPARTLDNRHTLKLNYSLRGIVRMIKAQWGISKYMRSAPTDSLADSLALGIVLQSLIMRLGKYGPAMAQHLADIQNAPAPIRKTLQQIQSVQMRRTSMSHVWNDVLPQASRDTAQGPEYFWDDGSEAPQEEKTQSTSAWKGQSVCIGSMTGIAMAVDSKTDEAAIKALKAKYNAPVILVFRAARPETTLLFPFADALIFAEGGVLSHACTVARESNIPAVTGAGQNCYDTAKTNPWLMMDGGAGTIICV